MVDCAGLENRRAARFRGFESHLLRHNPRSSIFGGSASSPDPNFKHGRITNLKGQDYFRNKSSIPREGLPAGIPPPNLEVQREQKC